jgi:hypothetical protein
VRTASAFRRPSAFAFAVDTLYEVIALRVPLLTVISLYAISAKHCDADGVVNQYKRLLGDGARQKLARQRRRIASIGIESLSQMSWLDRYLSRMGCAIAARSICIAPDTCMAHPAHSDLARLMTGLFAALKYVYSFEATMFSAYTSTNAVFEALMSEI